jgi:hypothetical protein
LERSKGLIYDHYYNIIKPALGGKVDVLMTDTDSLALRIETLADKDDILDRLEAIMDYSNYPKNSSRYSAARQNQLGFWKDELAGKSFEEFAGLASKTYSMQVEGREHGDIVNQSKCKGVKKGYRKTIPFSEYKKCLTGMEKHRVKQFAIQSKNHIIQTVSQNRLAFSSFDDKRYIMPCGIHSVPYGSRVISIVEQSGKCLYC